MFLLKPCFFLSILFLFGGCGRMVGDGCTTSTNCDTGQICDRTLPGGYCTKTDCHFFGCPSEAVCVPFNAFDNYCMLSCTENGDCRQDYECVLDFGDAPFCGAVIEDVP